MNDYVERFQDLEVYKEAFLLQQEIFTITRNWPEEEKFALISQVRRSSRSIGSNISESWAKRRYPAHFLSKLTDADGEAQETFHWLDTAKACSYINSETHSSLTDQLTSVARRLSTMIRKHQSFTI